MTFPLLLSDLPLSLSLSSQLLLPPLEVTYAVTPLWCLLRVYVICSDLRPLPHHMVHWDIRWAASALWHLMPQSSSAHLPPGSRSAPGKDTVCRCVCVLTLFCCSAPFSLLFNSQSSDAKDISSSKIEYCSTFVYSTLDLQWGQDELSHPTCRVFGQ